MVLGVCYSSPLRTSVPGRVGPSHRHGCWSTLPTANWIGVTIRRAVRTLPVVHSLHVVTSIPETREAVSFLGSFAVREKAGIWVEAVLAHTMGFPFVSEQAGIGGEPGVLAVRVGCCKLALVWP